PLCHLISLLPLTVPPLSYPLSLHDALPISIIIFDEATAYLDPENESLVQEAISKLVQGKTLIMVAHRLYTVTGANQLVVVNQGRIEATGTHEELLQKCPLYKEMWQAHIGSRDEGGATA